jgi:Fe2+ or Zn2+ uptake regulation protein
MSVAVVHRYWKADHHDHFYTTNAGEIGTTTVGQTGNHGYTFESSSFTVFNQHHHGLVPVYRYFHGGNHDHFYTANAGEIGAVSPGQTGNHGYTCEGILGYISPNEFPGSVPIYRYYQEQHHDHFYTTNAGEIGTTSPGQTGNHGYKFEGILGFAYPTDHHVEPVHRYYHGGHHDHFYTTNAGEIGTTTPQAVGNHGYTFESTPFFIFTHHHSGLVPVYRYFHEGNHDHFYTSNAGEIGTTTAGQTGNHGYKSEGVLGYVAPQEFYGSLPLYRYYQEQHHDHFYTTNAAEIGTTHPGHTGNHGYKFEGIVGYVVHH